MLGRIQKLDLTRPGAIEALLAVHREQFGDARMAVDDDDDADADADEDVEAKKKAAATKKAAARAAKKAAAGKGGADDDGDDDEEDEDEKRQKALTSERTKVRGATGVIAKLTGKSKTEVARALRKGGDALDGLTADEDGDDEDGDDDTPPAKKAAAKKTAKPKSEDQIRREVERDLSDKAAARAVRTEVRILAAETYIDPRDALSNLELDDYEVDEDGELVDPDKVKADLAEVLKKNPRYAKKKGPKADRSQGSRGTSGDRPKSMRDLSRMRVED